ncbi:hypothetical protein L1N85_04530 [Paenibacillus alkaliterrae]|uniref:hypothetical protein n=1 Tax=Paenibacillus alkaliterrae TaxID=320909 RepID=UPI001F43AF97|nr:hypothetical protein [Paenibacillus alkaliterrae]MCF2937700.1 hypothetical protein [Paenibacillus alkaliterrae]
MLRNHSKRRKPPRAAAKKRKPVAYKKRNKRRFNQDPGSFFPAYSKLIESVIGVIGDQILNIEIKLAVQQFLINETIDEWNRKGGFSESEVKSLYERTYQYWKNDLKEQGKPFAELDLMKRPALEAYKSKLEETGMAELAKPAPIKPFVTNPRREEDAELIFQMKEEMKVLKREFLKQKLDMMKRTLSKDTV